MTAGRHRHVEHEITVEASAGDVYGFLADIDNWPRLFPPTVHVATLDRTSTDERIQIWATANGDATTWVSRRHLDPDAGRITFRQERSIPPVGAMGGEWIVEMLGPRRCRVRLLHDFRALHDDPEALAWIDRAVDRNSAAELAALKAAAELLSAESELLLSFTDEVWVQGPPDDVFAFIYEAQLWEQRLPHVARVVLTEDNPGLQLLEMDTRANDGSVHTTTSVRVSLRPDRIVYKQVRLPALLTLHTGSWTFMPTGGGTRATSRHDVVLDPAAIERVLGVGATVEEARTYVRNVLGTNSLATLGHARDHVEGRASQHRDDEVPS